MTGPSALEAGDDTHAQQTKCSDHPGFRCPDLGGWVWKITAQGEKECLLCCTRGQRVAPVMVKFSASHESVMVFQTDINVINFRFASGLTFLFVSVVVTKSAMSDTWQVVGVKQPVVDNAKTLQSSDLQLTVKNLTFCPISYLRKAE